MVKVEILHTFQRNEQQHSTSYIGGGGGGRGGGGGCGGVYKKQVRLDPNSTNNLRRLRQDWYFWFGLRLLKFSLLHFMNFS